MKLRCRFVWTDSKSSSRRPHENVSKNRESAEEFPEEADKMDREFQ